MENSVVRLNEIKISDFKNVKNGQLSFDNKRRNFRAGILGLYGQNGSGKTSVIDALEILKYVLCGRKLPEEVVNYINIDAEYSSFEYVFDIASDFGSYKAYYSFSIKKEKTDDEGNIITEAKDSYRATVFNEYLSYSFESNEEKNRKTVLIDTNAENVFLPKAKYDYLIGNSVEDERELIILKRIAHRTSKSFIFSAEFLNILNNKFKDEEEYRKYLFLIKRLVFYGNYELFIANRYFEELINNNILPVIIETEERKKSRQILLPLNISKAVSEDTFKSIKNAMKRINIILNNIVPGNTIGVKECGKQISLNGEKELTLQPVFYKNNKELSFECISKGIKKLIYILQLLLIMYNNPSVTVAVDDFDSVIFEYILGEILRIISEKGKGQLIFTSNNLRPLETIDKTYAAFTTVNEYNKYIRISNIKESNNLRSVYLRDILLGGQSEELYQMENTAELAFNLREFGK